MTASERNWDLLPNVSGANIFLSLRCNLDCPYCYVDKSESDMDKDVLEAALDAVAAWARRHQGFFHTGFLGGEPLLRLGLLKYATDELERRAGREISFTVTTNGTVLTDEIVAWVRDRPIRLIVSCDGTPEAMSGRPYRKGGRPSHPTVASTIRRLTAENVPFLVQMTITPENCAGLSENVRHVASLGARRIIFGLATGNDWSEEQRRDLAREYARVFEWYKEVFRSETDVQLKFVHDEVTGYLAREALQNCEYACGMMTSVLAVGCTGGIYSCQAMVNYEDQRLGHVLEGLDPERVSAAVLPRVHAMPRCSECALRHFCRKCIAFNRSRTTDILQNPDVTCTAGITSAVLCEDFVRTMRAEGNRRFQHEFAHVLRLSSEAGNAPRTRVATADALADALTQVGPFASEELLPAYLPGAFGVPVAVEGLPCWAPSDVVPTTGEGRGNLGLEIGAYRHISLTESPT